MHVLVTGGSGFIGSHIVDELLSRNHDVRVLDDLSTSTERAATRDGDAQLVVGDLRDVDLVRRCLHRVDVVCHQAAKVGLGNGVSDLADYVARNDLATAVLLAEMATGDVGRLVLASSMVVYGEGGYECDEHGSVTPLPRERNDLVAGCFETRCPHCTGSLRWQQVDEDAPLDPRNGYAATKVAQENLAQTWARATGGSAAALRYHNVYGPRLPRDTPYAGVAALFRSALSNGKAPRVFEDGGQLRDFVHVRDVAHANVVAIEAQQTAGERKLTPYNIASGLPTTVRQMAEALSAALGGPPPVVTGEFRLGDVRHIVASPRRAFDQLGFAATIMFAEGMTEFAAEASGAA